MSARRRHYGLPIGTPRVAREPSHTDWGGPRVRFDSLLGHWLTDTFSRPCEGGPLIAWHFLTGISHHDPRFRNEREVAQAYENLYREIWWQGYLVAGTERALAKPRGNAFLPHEYGIGEDRYLFLQVHSVRYEEWGYGLGYDADELIANGAILGLRDAGDALAAAWDIVFDHSTTGRKFGWSKETDGWNPRVIADSQADEIQAAFPMNRVRLITPGDSLYREWVAEAVVARVDRVRRVLRVRGSEAKRLLDLAVNAHCSAQMGQGGYYDKPSPEDARLTAALNTRGITTDTDYMSDGFGAAWNIRLSGMEILVEGGLPLSMAVLAVEQGRPRWLRPSR